MRIAFLTRSLEYGGAERQLTSLARGLRSHGHDVTIVSLYDAIPLAAGLGEGVAVEIIGKRGRWDVLSFARRLIRVMRRIEPDVIHSYMPGANLICAFLRPFLPPVPLVWGVRSSDVDLSKFEWLTRFVYRAEPLLSRVPQRIIINSQAGRDYAIAHGYRRSRIEVVPNGFDVDAFQPDPEGRKRVREEWGLTDGVPVAGMVARLDPFKDHPTFLRAAANAARQRGDLRFVCVGDGQPERLQSYEQLAADLGIRDRVRFENARRDVRAVYSAFDVLCSSSTTEGFPNVIAEAMACGTPCVVTDAGDSRIIVGETGVVVPRGDAGAMAAGILKMLDDRRAGDLARDRIVREFSLATLVTRTEAALQAVRRA